MDFNVSDENRMLEETLDRFFSDKYNSQIREDIYASVNGYSDDVWQELCDLGMLSALLTETQGGFGGTGEDIGTLFQMIGKHAATEPLFSAGLLGLRLAAELNLETLVEIHLEGRRQITLAHFEPLSRYEIDLVQTSASLVDETYILNGHKSMVFGAVNCSQFFITARLENSNNIGIFIVDKALDGLSFNSQKLIDDRVASDLILNNVKVERAALVNKDSLNLLKKIHCLASLALSAEALGAMKSIRDLTTRYMKERKQFSKPLSSFQVIQHRCVEMVIEIEQLDALSIQACNDVSIAVKSETEQNWQRAIKSVNSLKYLSGKTGKLVAEESIQLHGGIGMTWEYPLGHFAKRIIMNDHQFGDSDYHLNEYVNATS